MSNIFEMKRARWGGLFAAVCAAAVFAAGCRAVGVEDKSDPFADGAPLVKGFPLSTHNLVLFTEKGHLALSAELEPEIAAAGEIAWTVEDEDVVTLEAEDGRVLVRPVGKGKTTITATLTARDGYAFDDKSTLSSECSVRVLDSFTLDKADLLFFAGESAAQSVEIELDVAELSALSQVATILWAVQSGSAASLQGENSGASAWLRPGSLGTATLRATLSAKNAVPGASAADFNGDGVNASTAITTLTAPTITMDSIGEVMLGAGTGSAAHKSFDVTAHYPAALDVYQPEVIWSSGDALKADVAPRTANPVGGGNAHGAALAKAVGTPVISATLQVAGRTYGPAAQAVNIVPYVEPFRSVARVEITGAPPSGTLPSTLKQTATSAEITAAALHSDGGAPDNTNINWTQNGTGSVTINPVTSPSTPNIRKITLTGGTPGVVTITATAQGDSTKFTAFTVTVQPPVVSWTTATPDSFVYGKSVSLGATTDITNKGINWSITAGEGNASLSVLNGAATVLSGTPAAPVKTSTPITILAVSAENANAAKTHTIAMKPHSFKITFNANGGGGTMAQKTAAYGDPAALPENTFTLAGHNFDGWTETADGTAVLTKINDLDNNTTAKTPDAEVMLYAQWTPIVYTVTYSAEGGTGTMAEESVAYGAVYTLKENGFTAPSDKVFKEWNVNGTGGKQPGSQITISGTLSIKAVWGMLGDVASGQESAQDLMVKFGIKPPDYQSATAADVNNTFLAVKAYINKPGVSASNVATENAKMGVIALRDYIDLPRLKVEGYASGGFDNEKVRVQVVAVNPYSGKNGNPSVPHLAFQFKNGQAERSMEPSGSNKVMYSGSEMRRYLTTVPSDSGSGNFLRGLLEAGVPSSAMWAPKRLLGKPLGGNTETLADLVFLPTVWEVSEGSTSTTGGSFTLSSGETASNQARFPIYGAGIAGNGSRNKGGGWWLATPSYESNDGWTTISGAFAGALTVAYTTAFYGVVPVFCIK